MRLIAVRCPFSESHLSVVQWDTTSDLGELERMTGYFWELGKTRNIYSMGAGEQAKSFGVLGSREHEASKEKIF